MADTHSDGIRVDGGKIEIWQREDGLFAVTMLPDQGQRGYPGKSYTSAEALDGFPKTYNVAALKEWGRKRWAG
jgi:hypothetical protein